MYLRQIILTMVYALSTAVAGANIPGIPESPRAYHQESPGGTEEVGTGISCHEAQMKCAQRSGCDLALQHYVIDCAGVLYENPNLNHCPISCQHALIALTSSDEGKELMQCNCQDDSCRYSKKKLEVCRPHVIKATRNESIVTCEIAQWICSSDGQCLTALEYYQNNCKAMFKGQKCTKKCRNSINILLRQEKAKKLSTCICQGHDDTECWNIQRNMDKLCFNKTREHRPERPETNEIEPFDSTYSCGSKSKSILSLSILSSSVAMVALLRSISGFQTAAAAL